MLLELLRDLVWGLPTVGLILGFGLYFTVQSRCIQLRGLKTLARETLRGKHASEKGCISPLRALSTALGGTVGIGSIVGVGLGISLGGAGSIFWMWVCGLLTAAVNYAEVYIAVARRRREGDGFVGGTMYCLDDAGRHGMAIFFSLCCILAAFGVGNLVQSNAIADVLAGVGAKPLFSAALLALLLALVIFDGRSRIAAVNAFLVPLFSALYILAMLFIILQNASAFPDALRRIFSEAFGLRAAAGGFSASLLSAALRVGVSKGIFSSEAGMGSSPIAHAAAEGTTPYRQGLWGVAEIVIDTFVVSTLTAFALLLSGETEMEAVFRNAFGPAGSYILLAFLAVFAFASILAWVFYADGCIGYLFGGRKKAVSLAFRLLSVLFVFGGVFLSGEAVWAAADIFNALMIFPNLFMLYIYRKEIQYGVL